MRIAFTPLRHPRAAAIVAMMCEQQGVTREHLLETIARRLKFRQARMYRQRSRRRTLEKLKISGGTKFPKRHEMKYDGLYAGEGELHALLRVIGMTAKEFYELVGISHAVFKRWYGHPLQPWPVEFLRYYAWATNMAKFLKELGYDTEKFKAKIPERMRKEGRYPRKSGDLIIEKDPGAYDPWTKKGSPFAPAATCPTPTPSKSKK